MKESRYTQEKIIGILKQHQAWLGAEEPLPQSRWFVRLTG